MKILKIIYKIQLLRTIKCSRKELDYIKAEIKKITVNTGTIKEDGQKVKAR